MSPQVGPQIPHLLNPTTSPAEDDEDEDACLPALPPDLVPPAAEDNGNEDAYVPARPPDDENEDAYVPARPPDLVVSKCKVGPTPTGNPPQTRVHDDDLSDSEDVGPMPAPAGPHANGADDPVREFMEREERRRKAAEEARQPKKLQREEWMLVPPSSSGVLGSLDPTKLKARQFLRSAKAAPVARDSSLWTETPAERQARLKDEVDGKRKRATDRGADDYDALKRDDRKQRKYDADVKAQVEEFNRQTRGSSMVDMHKSKSKHTDKDDGPPVIWDYARDMSVGGRLMDDGQRSKVINEARALGDRFGKGKSGGFL